MTFYAVGGLMVALAAVSWIHYRRTGGLTETKRTSLLTAPEWGDERDLGLCGSYETEADEDAAD